MKSQAPLSPLRVPEGEPKALIPFAPEVRKADHQPHPEEPRAKKQREADTPQLPEEPPAEELTAEEPPAEEPPAEEPTAEVPEKSFTDTHDDWLAEAKAMKIVLKECLMPVKPTKPGNKLLFNDLPDSQKEMFLAAGYDDTHDGAKLAYEDKPPSTEGKRQGKELEAQQQEVLSCCY